VVLIFLLKFMPDYLQENQASRQLRIKLLTYRLVKTISEHNLSVRVIYLLQTRSDRGLLNDDSYGYVLDGLISVDTMMRAFAWQCILAFGCLTRSINGH